MYLIERKTSLGHPGQTSGHSRGSTGYTLHSFVWSAGSSMAGCPTCPAISQPASTAVLPVRGASGYRQRSAGSLLRDDGPSTSGRGAASAEAHRTTRSGSLRPQAYLQSFRGYSGRRGTQVSGADWRQRAREGGGSGAPPARAATCRPCCRDFLAPHPLAPRSRCRPRRML